MRYIATAATVLFLAALPAPAGAACHSHHCWHAVHVHRVERYVQRKIDAITPFHCFGDRFAVPCRIIGRESATTGLWTALNRESRGVPCATRACGAYQFLGWRVPWPVIVASKLETLKRKLAHHRMARRLWGQQVAGAACHWCY